MARLAGCGLLTIPAHLKAEEPFDSLPLAVWQNARRNGLVMIHHPTPGHMSSRIQVASNDEPGEALIVSGQYSRRTVAHRFPGSSSTYTTPTAQATTGKTRPNIHRVSLAG